MPEGSHLNENESRLMTGTSAGARHYVLVCSSCGRREADDGLVLGCSGKHAPALLRTEYVNRSFSPRSDRKGLFRYQSWLPVVRTQGNVGRTAVYRSKGLGKVLELPNLWIAFNGYWPERDAILQTATFKEFEGIYSPGQAAGTAGHPDGRIVGQHRSGVRVGLLPRTSTVPAHSPWQRTSALAVPGATPPVRKTGGHR
jgi:hypothetical protein